MPDVLMQHLQNFLGQASGSEPVLLDRRGRTVSLQAFVDRPCQDATTFVTHGLSHLHELHQELLLSCWSSESSLDLRLVIEFVARQLAEGREALMEGDVIGPAGPLVPETKMEALYVCQPTYFPDGFAEVVDPQGCTVLLRWLIPIHPDEASMIEQQGAISFERRLAALDPDLLSLQRSSIA